VVVSLEISAPGQGGKSSGRNLTTSHYSYTEIVISSLQDWNLRAFGMFYKDSRITN